MKCLISEYLREITALNLDKLKCNAFIDQLESKIPEFKETFCYLEDKGLTWNMIKMEIRERRDIAKKLSKQLDSLMKTLVTNRTKENITKLYRLRSELDKIAAYRTKGAIIRSRTRWHKQGEKNTKYFLNLEKRQNSDPCISRLILDNGQEITNPDEILKQQKFFYKNLYTCSTY